MQVSVLFRVWFRQESVLFRVWFIQDSVLSRVWFMQDSVLFRVWFRQVSLYIWKTFVLSLYNFEMGVRVMVFNATFNNISVISCRSILLMEETGVPRENH
jgi:hypothetical protein